MVLPVDEDHKLSDRIDPDHVDAMLAAELNQMTFQEREQVLEELHGVDKATHETEGILAMSLAAMDLALQHVPNRAIYDKAKNINARYVEDRSFRLMFLRSEDYNAERAASRLVNFLENKVKFFGKDTLARPVYLSDMDKDDIAVLKSGILQLIPARDRSGRVILSDFNMNTTNIEQPKDMNNYVRRPFHFPWNKSIVVDYGFIVLHTYSSSLSCRLVIDENTNLYCPRCRRGRRNTEARFNWNAVFYRRPAANTKTP